MRFLGIFDKELPDPNEYEAGDVCVVKMTSPYYDRYELLYLSALAEGHWLNAQFGNDKHGIVKYFPDGLVEATTCYSKFGLNRSFTRHGKGLEEGLDLVITNYLRHMNRLREGRTTLAEYKGIGYFCADVKGFGYVSGYRRPNGKTYIHDLYGRSVISGKEMGAEDVFGYIQTLERLNQIA